MIRERIEKVNVAIRNGDIAVTPGLSTVRILNREQAIEALAPGVLDAKLLNADSRGKVPTFLATVGGQWIPPGITVELSPGETQQLLNLLVLGGTVAALSLLLESFGLAAPIAGAMAVVLLSQAAAVKICKELSATGAVGFKIAVLTYPVPFIVIPYPV